MDSTCLRIKFTPLLQNLQKDNPNHCLEIVPEVTCIQNLDKIQWYKEENSIEYTIPMTYKVILRKKVISKNYDLNKIYYSCVDLLVPSASFDTNLTQFGSGDIKRIVSDTFILTNVTADDQKCSIILKEPNEMNTLVNDINQPIIEAQSNIRRFTSTACQSSTVQSSKCIESPKASSAVPSTSAVIHSESLVHVSDVDVTKCLKKTDDHITITNFIDDIETEIKPRKIIANAFTIKSKIDTKYKLSLTPICSIGTDDNFISDEKVVPSSSYLYRGNDSVKDIGESITYTVANFKAPNSYLYCDIFNMKTSCARYNLSSTVPQFEYTTRILPEVRVANFVQQLEKEIHPLKIMLSEIINKCSRLGYDTSKLHSSVLYKSVKHSDKQFKEKTCNSNIKDQTKSNRVVYSFVFDG